MRKVTSFSEQLPPHTFHYRGSKKYVRSILKYHLSVHLSELVDDDTYQTVMTNKCSKVGAAQRVNLESSEIVNGTSVAGGRLFSTNI